MLILYPGPDLACANSWRIASGASSALTAEEKKFVVGGGLQLGKADTKKRKRTAIQSSKPAARTSSPHDTTDPSKLTSDETTAVPTAATLPEATITSPGGSTNAVTQPPTPVEVAAEMDATLAAIEAEQAGESSKRHKIVEKGFEYWASKKLDYEPKARPARGGKKAKRKRERQQAAERAARRTGPINWKAHFNIRRSNAIREFISKMIDAQRLEEWTQVLHSFDKETTPEVHTGAKPIYSDMFAPPAAFSTEGTDNARHGGDEGTMYRGEKDFGKRMMENYGWQQGHGLGVTGNEGITKALYVAKKKGGFGIIRGGKKT